MSVWTHTKNGRKQNSQKGIIYEFGNNKIERWTKKQMARQVREDGRTVGGEGWQEKVHNREEWKKLLRMGKESSQSAYVNGMNK